MSKSLQLQPGQNKPKLAFIIFPSIIWLILGALSMGLTSSVRPCNPNALDFTCEEPGTHGFLVAMLISWFVFFLLTYWLYRLIKRRRAGVVR